jgi:nucleoside-diphosphate kinase
VNIETTFVILKPSTTARGMIGNIITRIENKGLKIVAMKLIQITPPKAQQLYEIHQGKPFYPNLIQYITSAPTVALIIEGQDAVATIRTLIGNTNPKEAQPGTIRGDLALTVTKNAVHASDSAENAQKEASIFFTKDEIVNYKRADENWIY